jgi:hypothetical protein
MFNQVKNTSNELQKIRDELREVVVKRSGMLSLSHQDEKYSAAKIDNWSKDIEKLQEKEALCLEDLAAIKSSEAFQKEMDKLEAGLDAKNKKLQVELKKAEEQVQALRFEIAGNILEGGDPYELSVQIDVTKKHIELLKNALEGISQAYRVLVKISEPVMLREKIQTVDPHHIPAPTGQSELPQYRS